MSVLHRDRKVELLRSVPLFSGCSKKELQAIGRIADEIDCRPGRALIREGAPGSEFFVLVDGTVEVTRKGRAIDAMGPGDFFGEMALLTSEPRNATVTTTSAVHALVITARSFRQLVTDNPLIALKVMRAVAERVPDPVP
ncbi:MAG TPA: cyclic nucleotide-binding domain-containing protein [Gaiellaceae bacterium]|nr:cyclic nucleotide-binding domain-containing protein [Gaiellaceae bacterium]